MRKIYVARERMIGWYHTGPKLRASDQEINDLFKRFIARPVMVIVDVRAQVVGMPTDAYFAVEEIKDVCGESFNSSWEREINKICFFFFGIGWYRNTKDIPPRSICH